MSAKKKIWQNLSFQIGIVVTIGIITIIVITIYSISNKMTPEETVSKFMYLVENKQYEEAKKLSDGKLEYLDVLSNIKPSDLRFEFTEDKKIATTILIEEELIVTKMKVQLKNTIMGWKIESYKVNEEPINPQTIENRLKEGKKVTDIQLLYWGESDVSTKEEIKEYIEKNEIVAIIFAETMKSKNYDKANELYQPVGEISLTVEQLKQYDWNNYEITSNLEVMKGPKGDLNSIRVKIGNKELGILIAARSIVSIN